MPIESAPMDGDDCILLYGNTEHGGEIYQVAYYAPQKGNDLRSFDGHIWKAEEWCWCVVDGTCHHKDTFTHWQPLPAPPV